MVKLSRIILGFLAFSTLTGLLTGLTAVFTAVFACGLSLALTGVLAAVLRGGLAGDLAGALAALEGARLADTADLTALVLRVTRDLAEVTIFNSK